jgi:hypothetical protein
MDGAGQLIDALVDCHLVVYRGIPWESVFKASLECAAQSIRVKSGRTRRLSKDGCHVLSIRTGGWSETIQSAAPVGRSHWQ